MPTCKFQAPVQVLNQHWSRNGEPRPPAPHRPASRMIPLQDPAPPPTPAPGPTPHQEITHPTVVPLATPVLHPQPSQTPAPTQRPITSLFHPTGDPTKHGSWSGPWRRFLELARLFVLNELLFVHGFPTPFVLRNQAGEALTHAWKVFERTNPHEPLNKFVCKFALPFLIVLLKTVHTTS